MKLAQLNTSTQLESMHTFIESPFEHEYFLMFELVLQFPTICHIYFLFFGETQERLEFKYDLLNRHQFELKVVKTSE